MPLTNLQCQNAQPKTKPYKLSDSSGMYLEVMPNGSKYWRLKYRWSNKEKRLALGVFPLVGLAEAREKRDAARKLLASGVDPSLAKKQAREEATAEAANTFEALAREWHEKQKANWTPSQGRKVLRYLEHNLFPYLGTRPAREIEPPELLNVLRKIEARGAHYNSGRIRQYAGRIFRYGIACGKVTRDPSADLQGALTTSKTKHYAALDLKDMPGFLEALAKNEARLFNQTRRAIRLLMLVFTRTSELILATWDEFDLEKGTWEIPAERMKMRRPHIVPLSRQAVALLREQHDETKHLQTKWVFPNQPRPLKPMSNNTILFGIGRLGYKGDMTGHGFRALARTALRENLGYDVDVIEAQLAHAKGDSVRRAYDRTTFIPQRRVMMQEWTDFLEEIEATGKIPAPKEREK